MKELIQNWMKNEFGLKINGRKIKVMWCALADKEHRKRQRQFAHTYHKKNMICLARAIMGLPLHNIQGIIWHELGHLVIGPKGSEEAANRKAKKLCGHQIKYDARRVQYI